MIGDDAHRFGERPEVSIERAVIVAHDDRFARLVGGNDQTDPQAVEELGEIRRMHTAKVGRAFRLRRSLGNHRYQAKRNCNATETIAANLCIDKNSEKKVVFGWREAGGFFATIGGLTTTATPI